VPTDPSMRSPVPAAIAALLLLAACDSAAGSCDAPSACGPDGPDQPVGLTAPGYETTWAGTYTVQIPTMEPVTYQAEYVLQVDLVETADGDAADLGLSDRRNEYRPSRNASGLEIYSYTDPDRVLVSYGSWSFDRDAFHGRRGAFDDGVADLTFSGPIGAGLVIETYARFEGTVSLRDSTIVGTLACLPAFRGCDTIPVTFRPSAP